MTKPRTDSLIKTAAPPRWRTLVLVLAAACALAGCDTAPAQRTGDAAGTQGQSGITVYGTVDAGVSRSR